MEGGAVGDSSRTGWGSGGGEGDGCGDGKTFGYHERRGLGRNSAARWPIRWAGCVGVGQSRNPRTIQCSAAIRGTEHAKEGERCVVVSRCGGIPQDGPSSVLSASRAERGGGGQRFGGVCVCRKQREGERVGGSFTKEGKGIKDRETDQWVLGGEHSGQTSGQTAGTTGKTSGKRKGRVERRKGPGIWRTIMENGKRSGWEGGIGKRRREGGWREGGAC